MNKVEGLKMAMDILTEALSAEYQQAPENLPGLLKARELLKTSVEEEMTRRAEMSAWSYQRMKDMYFGNQCHNEEIVDA